DSFFTQLPRNNLRAGSYQSQESSPNTTETVELLIGQNCSKRSQGPNSFNCSLCLSSWIEILHGSKPHTACNVVGPETWATVALSVSYQSPIFPLPSFPGIRISKKYVKPPRRKHPIQNNFDSRLIYNNCTKREMYIDKNRMKPKLFPMKRRRRERHGNYFIKFQATLNSHMSSSAAPLFSFLRSVFVYSIKLLIVNSTTFTRFLERKPLMTLSALKLLAFYGRGAKT
ncbi:hypothetical protein C0J52_26617, partial [Blattella germanica]